MSPPSLKLRIRGPSGVSSLPESANVTGEMTLKELANVAAEAAGVVANDGAMRMRAGFPPTQLRYDLQEEEGRTLSEIGLQSGELITVTGTKLSEDDAAKGNDNSNICRKIPSKPSMVRRIMADDNSCLFSAISYLMLRQRSAEAELRCVVADAIMKDNSMQVGNGLPQFNEGILGQDPASYCTWIKQPSSWGGPIELNILAQHFGVMINAYDIRTMRKDTYGGIHGVEAIESPLNGLQKCYIIYDGLHYDALALSPSPSAPEYDDITTFVAGSEEERIMEDQAMKYVSNLHVTGNFTDTSSFTLQCSICMRGLKGEKEAMMHAQMTGHSKFQEYK